MRLRVAFLFFLALRCIRPGSRDGAHPRLPSRPDGKPSTTARSKPRPSRRRSGSAIYMERMAAKPHHAGSPGSKAVADYLAAQLTEWGLDTRIETFRGADALPHHAHCWK